MQANPSTTPRTLPDTASVTMHPDTPMLRLRVDDTSFPALTNGSVSAAQATSSGSVFPRTVRFADLFGDTQPDNTEVQLQRSPPAVTVAPPVSAMRGANTSCNSSKRDTCKCSCECPCKYPSFKRTTSSCVSQDTYWTLGESDILS